MPLTLGQQTVVIQASREAIEGAFRNLLPYLAQSRWLETANPYLPDPVQVLKTQLKQNGPGISNDALRDYIAASAPVHCWDGWSFLGRAIDSHTRGDSDAARHLAYYAELRAAMSFLATQGLGIFSQQHFAVDSTGVCRLVPRSDNSATHKITWMALEYWPQLPDSEAYLMQLITPHGITLDSWLKEFRTGSATLNLITAEWLRTWGMDLGTFGGDRESRNYSSYRPTYLQNIVPATPSESSTFLCELWRMCEPGISRFEVLDRHIWRMTLRRAFKAISPLDHAADPIGFRRRIANMLQAVIPDSSMIPPFSDFLLGVSDPSDILMEEAAKTDPVTHARHHMQVLARATLLLRLASAAVARLFTQAGVGRQHLEFWVQAFAANRGISSASDPLPDVTADMWQDIEPLITDEMQWVSAGAAASIREWRRQRLPSISRFGEMERVALWGSGL